MKSTIMAAAVLMALATPAFSAEMDVPHHRGYAQPATDDLVIDYSHNYGPADFYPGTTVPPDRVVTPVSDRPYGIYDGFDRYCAQSSANYRGQDGRRHPCN